MGELLMKKNLPNVFANKKIGLIKNNEEMYYSKEGKKLDTSLIIDDNFKEILIRKKINDLFNSKDFVYKVNALITTKDGDKNVTLIAKGKDSLLTYNNEKILIKDIIDIKKA